LILQLSTLRRNKSTNKLKTRRGIEMGSDYNFKEKSDLLDMRISMVESKFLDIDAELDKQIDKILGGSNQLHIVNEVKKEVEAIRENFAINNRLEEKTSEGYLKEEPIYEGWSKYDIIVTFIAGLLGVISSSALRYEGFGATKVKDGSLVSNGGILNDLHYSHFRESNNPMLFKLSRYFKHPNNPFDQLEGSFHRLRYGHDILNPFQKNVDGVSLWEEMKRYSNEDTLYVIKKLNSKINYKNKLNILEYKNLNTILS